MALRTLLFGLLLISTMLSAKTGGNERKDNTPSYYTFSVAPNAFATAGFTDDVPTGTQIIDDVTFGVFLGTFTYPLPIESEYCKKIRDVLTVTCTDIGYIYSVGAFNNYQQAEQYRQHLLNDGYINADIISFYKNVPVLEIRK